jgi:hypothetical protein
MPYGVQKVGTHGAVNRQAWHKSRWVWGSLLGVCGVSFRRWEGEWAADRLVKRQRRGIKWCLHRSPCHCHGAYGLPNKLPLWSCTRWLHQ